MSGDHIILFWFHDDWGKYGRAYEKMAEALSNNSKIKKVFVIYPPNTSQVFYGHLPKFEARRISSKLTVIASFAPKNLGKDCNLGLLHRLLFWISFRVLLLANGFRKNNTILWNCPPHPFVYSLVKHIPHKESVTQVMDDFSVYEKTFWLYPYAVEQYPRLGKISKLIFVTSNANYEKFSKIGNCYQFEMGVSRNFFGTPKDQDWHIAKRKPVLGYVGWFSERTDIQLLFTLAKRRPEWQFHLIGPQHGNPLPLDSSGILSLSNVHYYGEIPNSNVPSYIKDFDVCLIPHLDTAYSRSMSPLKLYQYLASGRPIVSTNVAGLEKVGNLISIVDNYEDFENAVEVLLKEDTKTAGEARIRFAASKTWDSQAEDLLGVISSLN